MMVITVLMTLIQPFLVVISLLMLLATYRDLFSIHTRHYMFIMPMGLSVFVAAFHLTGTIPVFLLLLLILGNRTILHVGLPEARIIRWNGFGLLFIGILAVSILIWQLQVGWSVPLVEYQIIYWVVAASNVMLFFLTMSGIIFVQFGEGRKVAASMWFAVVGVSMMFGFWCGNLMYGEAQQMMCTNLAVIPAWIMLNRFKKDEGHKE